MNNVLHSLILFYAYVDVHSLSYFICRKIFDLELILDSNSDISKRAKAACF